MNHVEITAIKRIWGIFSLEKRLLRAGISFVLEGHPTYIIVNRKYVDDMLNHKILSDEDVDEIKRWEKEHNIEIEWVKFEY